MPARMAVPETKAREDRPDRQAPADPTVSPAPKASEARKEHKASRGLADPPGTVVQPDRPDKPVNPELMVNEARTDELENGENQAL